MLASDRLLELQKKFTTRYCQDSRVYRAPGRVNLIGEHTDYNDGFVMPAAIEFYTWAGIAPRDDRRLVVYSENFSETREFDLDEPSPEPGGHWSDYVLGVALELEQAGCRLRGANLLIDGEVPIGSGLSSSASVEVAAGYALLDNSGISIDRVQLAKSCQSAENYFVGTRCGIMDQFVSCCGHAGQALMLDCRSLAYKLLSLPDEVSLVICNTMVKHEHASGEYNARRKECETGVRELAGTMPHVSALRDVTLDDLEWRGSDLPELIYRRCRHVISENQRVREAALALEKGNFARFGQLMLDSHTSLRDDYQVSCMELDTMVEAARSARGCYGARMTGGGFGGCTINLVKTAHAEEFRQSVAHAYRRATGSLPEIYICSAAEGACRIYD